MQPLFLFPNKEQLLPDIKEIKRYLGFSQAFLCNSENKIDSQLEKMIQNAATEMQKILVPKCCWCEFELSMEGEKIEFSDLSFISKHLSVNLRNSTKIILIATTIGPLVDQKIRKAQLTSSTEGAIYQATGAMFVEVLTDFLNNKLSEDYKNKGYISRPRFSPGYGDIPLEMQKNFFRILPLEKIGLSLMESLIMAPEKSVTAFIGLEKKSD